jgi:hypothetical protein
MKYIFAIFVIFQIMSYSALAIDQLSVTKVKLEVAEQNKIRTKQSDLCGLYNSVKDQQICNDAFDRVSESVVATTVGGVINSFNTVGQKEFSCIDDQRKILKSAGLSFDGTETCSELKYAYCIYEYTKLLTDAGQSIPPENDTCDELKAQWRLYQESQSP